MWMKPPERGRCGEAYPFGWMMAGRWQTEARSRGEISEREAGFLYGKLVCSSSENRERTGDGRFVQGDCQSGDVSGIFYPQI